MGGALDSPPDDARGAKTDDPDELESALGRPHLGQSCRWPIGRCGSAMHRLPAAHPQEMLNGSSLP